MDVMEIKFKCQSSSSIIMLNYTTIKDQTCTIESGDSLKCHLKQLNYLIPNTISAKI